MTTEPRVPPEALPPTSATSVPSWLDQVREALTDPAGGGGHDGLLPYAATTEVPFAAVHHWHAGAVAELIAEAAVRHGAERAPHDAVRAVHVRAAAGEAITEDAWSAVLEPALREVYRLAYPRERVYSRASSAAASFARSRGWSEDEAERYGETYARTNTEASARVHAEANALANSAAYAAAFATGSAEEYARAWPFATVRAWIAAYAGPAGADGPAVPEAQEARERLRNGLTDAVATAAVN
ncbi:SpcZ [Streptomyces paludis]|uniref:SpcZ n=1 Tax=Streptomyces paludis TaxID=2282738 RepID=UPI0013B38F7C|nr:SpcZ [Streptomyces paludis]